MPPIVTFIGWHNSGKTTLASRVVVHLKERGYRVAVVKHTKERTIVFDRPGTDTHTYLTAGADAVTLVTPDQMIIQTGGDHGTMDLSTLANRFFPDMDLVIGEGFKHDPHVAKIEVCRGPQKKQLRDQVSGVIAIATDQPLLGRHVFRIDASHQLAEFIEQRFLRHGKAAGSCPEP